MTSHLTPSTEGRGTRRGRVGALIAAGACSTLILTASVISPAQAQTEAPQSALTASTKSTPANAKAPTAPRVIVTSDMELDDVASWHRFLLYTNDLDVEGLVYTSSRFHWAGDPANGVPASDWAGNDILEQIISGYGEFGSGGGYAAVYENLREHDPRYPSPEELLAKVRLGNISNVGEYQQDTAGSDLIKSLLLDQDDTPVNLLAWGGTNTIAAALRSIEREYSGTAEWDAVRRQVVDKAHVYIVYDQDATYKEYIAQQWPDVQVTMNYNQFFSVAYKTFRDSRIPADINAKYFGAPFMSSIAKGPLLETYPLGDGGPIPGLPFVTPVGEYISEGDSPSYWSLIPNGLRSDENPTYGGWGGRFDQVDNSLYTDVPSYVGRPGQPTSDSGVAGAQTPRLQQFAPQSRWIPALQNDFAARASWTTESFDEANHHPVVSVPKGRLDISAKAGQKVVLAGHAVDPDRDNLVARWWQYPEAGTYKGSVVVARSTDSRGYAAEVRVPQDAQSGDTIHMILEVTDDGEVPLTRYQRVIITVK